MAVGPAAFPPRGADAGGDGSQHLQDVRDPSASPDRRASSQKTLGGEHTAAMGEDGKQRVQEAPTADIDEKDAASSSTRRGNSQDDKAPVRDAPATAPAPNADHAPENERTPLETFLVMFALCLALFLAALDMTIVTTAIPTISSTFDSSVGYVWIGSAYLLGNAAVVPTWGKVSDIFGRKPVLIAAVVTFWIGSLLCALSNSMGMLIAARAIQGVGGGGTIALPNICISDLFSMRKRGMYFGVLGCVWAVASALGPILGGVFTSKVSWRWCFYINLPLGGIGILILVFVLKLYNPRTPVKQGLAAIDWLGSLLVIGGTLMLLFGLQFGGVQYPWDSPTVICLIVFGLFTIALFALYERTVPSYPIIPVALFRSRTSVASYALAFLQAFTFISGSYWLPLYFQAVLGAGSLLSGVYLLPFALALSITSAVSGVFIKKTGNYKMPILFGFFIMTLGFGLFIDLGDDQDWAKIIIFQIIAGIGVGPNFQAPLIALQTKVEPRDIGSATSSYGFLRQLGTSISVVVGGVVFNNEMDKQNSALSAAIGPDLAQMFTGSRAASSVSSVATLPSEVQGVVKSTYWNALQRMYIVFTCFAFVGFLVSFLITQKKLSKKHTEFQTGLKSLKHRTEHNRPTAVDEESAAPPPARPRAE